jgi:hypothetical protein
LRANDILTSTPASVLRRKAASCADSWREKLGYEESVSRNRYAVGALYSRRRQVAEIAGDGADRHLFFSICWLSCQHGAHQSNNR